MLSHGTAYGYVPEDITRFVEGLYQQATKTGSDDPDNSSQSILPIVIVGAIVCGTAAALFLTRKKKKRK